MLESGDTWEHEGWTYRVVPEISTESEYFIEARQNVSIDGADLYNWNYILTKDRGITHLVAYEEYEAEFHYGEGLEPESEVYTARRATQVWRAVGEGVGQMSEVCGSTD